MRRRPSRRGRTRRDAGQPKRNGPLSANVGNLRKWGAHVLAISSQPDRREVVEGVRHLRLNFLAKNDLAGNALLAAIKSTAAGELVLSPRLVDALIGSDSNIPDLTDREQQVMRLLASGRTPGQIARRLAIREDTVRRHQANIREKYEAAGRKIDNPVRLHYAALHDEIITDLDDSSAEGPGSQPKGG